MRVTFRCGHEAVTLERTVKDTPTCPQCGERRVKMVTGATPRITGACQGPLVTKGTP